MSSEWKIKRCKDYTIQELYTVSRVVNRRRVFLEYQPDGSGPMLYGRKQAEEAVAVAANVDEKSSRTFGRSKSFTPDA